MSTIEFRQEVGNLVLTQHSVLPWALSMPEVEPERTTDVQRQSFVDRLAAREQLPVRHVLVLQFLFQAGDDFELTVGCGDAMPVALAIAGVARVPSRQSRMVAFIRTVSVLPSVVY